eukprot:CAMPEP_0202028844 /NCGR_PEP_ID=MMETSP0905-20130828/63663_1 /ASSEMBLY_ACC=CAM_ASM_000554 /TAXON_ID=420261 /ORGANISM="Thalassiosira antarctica, Strain CCMP982" /LENGTH=254 /DNA_ID=CAMNT_0048592567 /DNA_START=28 /DNA_END=795 /DNA_ORIENTATION=+
MAGLGRRSHYRKHLTDAVLHDLPEPDGIGQRIARVVGTRGGNMFDVIVAPPSSNKDVLPITVKFTQDDASQSKVDQEEIISGENGTTQSAETSGEPPPIHNLRAPQLAFLPTKFRKLVWIKRNDFVIVECGDEEEEGTQQLGFRYVITNILYKDQVKHIKSKGLWPSDPYFGDEVPDESGTGPKGDTEAKEDQQNGDKEDKEESNPDDNNEECEGTYEDNGIVFDGHLEDEFMVNTNRIATLRVDDSSSDEDSD